MVETSHCPFNAEQNQGSCEYQFSQSLVLPRWEPHDLDCMIWAQPSRSCVVGCGALRCLFPRGGFEQAANLRWKKSNVHRKAWKTVNF